MAGADRAAPCGLTLGLCCVCWVLRASCGYVAVQLVGRLDLYMVVSLACFWNFVRAVCPTIYIYVAIDMSFDVFGVWSSGFGVAALQRGLLFATWVN